MTQAVNVLNGGHAFNVLNLVDQKTINTNPSFDYKLVRRGPVNEKPGKRSLIQWLEKSGFVKGLSVTTLPADKIFSNERVTLQFQLADKYNSFFVLLKGLFGFKKPNGISVTPDRSTKSFTIEIQSANEEEISNYFKNIFSWVSKELRFKEVLREVIRFEQKVKREQALLISTLQSSVR